MLLLFACVGPSGQPGAPTREMAGVDTADTADSAETADTVDTAEPADTADSAAPAGFACPADMVGVPAESPAWCIDPWEATVSDGLAVSVAGVLPEVGITYEEAAAACAATPALDADGAVYAMRRLPTAQEWADAGDGVLGEGGTTYPWGDTFDDTRCATLTTDGAVQFNGLQPTGSLPGCVSVLGVYDQVGNAWEWTDSEQILAPAAALATFAGFGVELVEESDGVRIVGGSASALQLEAAGVQPPTVSATADGYLEVTAAQVQPDPESFFARGYLVLADAPLPVRHERLASGEAWRVHVAWEYDGRVLPDKRGCAWYTGTGYGCALATPSLVHLPDFDGTIGFRCVAPPYAR